MRTPPTDKPTVRISECMNVGVGMDDFWFYEHVNEVINPRRRREGDRS